MNNSYNSYNLLGIIWFLGNFKLSNYLIIPLKLENINPILTSKSCYYYTNLIFYRIVAEKDKSS